eukprot:COSAG01_NODE_2244_length_8081_cov_4.590829_8_plen_50_part_00
MGAGGTNTSLASRHGVWYLVLSAAARLDFVGKLLMLPPLPLPSVAAGQP